MRSVSVVIPTYNAEDTLGLQLEALAHQTDAPQFDVIVVDNGSARPPTNVVAHHAAELSVRIVTAAFSQGVAYARNVGLATATTDYVIFLDADDCAGPEFVGAAVAALHDCDFVTGNVFSLAPDVFAGGREGVWRALAERRAGQHGFEPEMDRSYPIFMGGASAVRREAAVMIGGFDQAFVPGAEDNDFGLRALEAGFRVRRCEGMVLGERRRATSGQALRRSYEAGRMHMRLCRAHDLWRDSPHLRRPRWWIDLLRVPAAGVRMALVTRDRASRQAWSSRAGLRIGQGVGFVTFRLLRQMGESQLGFGLADDTQ